MSNTSSFEEFSGSPNEESVDKTCGLTWASSEESFVEVISLLSNAVAAEVTEQKKSSLSSGYEWVHYEVREKFSNFQCCDDLLNFARSATILENCEVDDVINTVL